MKILITGITGFLGTQLLKRLVQKFELIGITGTSNNTINDQRIKIYKNSELNNIKEIPDVVVMCHAAISAGKLNESNRNLYFSNVEFTEKIASIFPNAFQIYTSSVSVYGNNADEINEFSSVNPTTEYAISKLWGEACLKNATASGILRLSSLYGNGMKENTIIPHYVNQALKNGSIEVWGNGQRRQNYIHVDDATRYIENMILNESKGIFLGTAESEISNLELATIIATLTNSQINITGSDDSISSHYNNSYTNDILKISTHVEIKEGLGEYISWKTKQF